MKNTISKEIFSSSAKKISKELESMSIKTLSYQSIIQIIQKESSETLKSAYEPNYSLIGLSKKKTKIQEIIYKKTGFRPSDVDFFKRKINERVAVFRDAKGSYTLAQYMQYYKILTNRDPFKEDILTNTQAINRSQDFIFDLYLKYKKVNNYNVNNYLKGKSKSIDFQDLEEIYIILKKKENKTHLSNCDIVLNEIIKKMFEIRVLNFKYYNDNPTYLLDEIKSMVEREIIRTKILSESRLDCRCLIEKITPYNFSINTDKENDLVKKIMEENKKIFSEDAGISFGWNNKKSKKLYSKFEKEIFVLKKQKANFSFFDRKEYIGLTNKQLEDGLYTSSTIGSGYMETLFNYFIQAFNQNESVIFFNVYGDPTIFNSMQAAKRIADGNGESVVIGNNDFLTLTKEKMLSLLSKDKSVFFNLPAIEKLSVNDVEKQIKKIRYLMKIIGEYKKDRYYNIFINDANIIFSEKNRYSKQFADDFHKMKKSFNNTKLFLRGTGSLNKEMFKLFKYKILMKTECEMGFDIFNIVDFEQKKSNIGECNSYKAFKNNIMSLDPGEFIFVIDNRVSLKNKIYKSNYYSPLVYSEKTIFTNFDLND